MKGINRHSECPVLDISIPCWKRQGLKSNKCYLVATALASRATCNTLWFARQKPERRGGGLWKSQGALTVLDAASTLFQGKPALERCKINLRIRMFVCLGFTVSVTFPLSFISIRSVEIAETFSFGQFLMWSHLQHPPTIPTPNGTSPVLSISGPHGHGMVTMAMA